MQRAEQLLSNRRYEAATPPAEPSGEAILKSVIELLNLGKLLEARQLFELNKTRLETLLPLAALTEVKSKIAQAEQQVGVNVSALIALRTAEGYREAEQLVDLAFLAFSPESEALKILISRQRSGISE